MSTIRSIFDDYFFLYFWKLTSGTSFLCRSGSTLLETMLDSHSRIWGMGEDSFFNANLTEFRNKLVGAPNIKGHSFGCC